MDIQDVGAQRPRGVIAEAQPLHRLAPDIMDEDIGAGDQPRHRRAILFLFEVERDRALASIERAMDRPHLALGRARSAELA